VTLTISPAQAADVPALAELAGQLGYPATPSELGPRLVGMLARPDEHRIWVARFEDRPIGWLHAFVARYLFDDPYAEIGGLVVAEGERGHGVGARLLDELFGWARSRGFDRVGVHSNVLRPDAHRFYERAGFVLEKRQGVFSRRLERA
jgi:GNAT superfamily N-acetyltransferase